MNYLLDTCAISEPAMARPNAKVVAWLDTLPLEATYLSTITVGEIEHGIARLVPSRRRQRLDDWLRTMILPQYAGRILAIDVDVALHWGQLVAALEQRGRKIPLADSLIAAVALAHDMVLVTRDSTHFLAAGARVRNPWEES